MPTFASTRVQHPRTQALTRAATPPLVLVVDDHADSRLIARLVLESAGFRVAEAESGGEALRVAVALRPAAVLLDLVLPELDGWEVAHRLREAECGRDIAIIAFTAVGLREEHERALAAGCDAIITKPALPRAVVAALGERIGFPMPEAVR